MNATKWITTPCKVCGKPIGHWDTTIVNYCSLKCRKERRNITKLKKKMGRDLLKEVSDEGNQI